MKVVDLSTFLDMPIGTVFQKYQPHVFDHLQTYEGRLGQDFLTGDFSFEPISGDSPTHAQAILETLAEKGESHPVEFDNVGRDALFDKGQMFAVWEPDDVRALIAHLQRALPEAA